MMILDMTYKPKLPLDKNEPLSLPRPVPKPSQSSLKKRGRKPKETKDETDTTE